MFDIKFAKEVFGVKKIICKVEYDTENAELVAKYTNGQFGDAAGYEESLYKTAEGKYFIYVNGGADSVYPEENIKRIAQGKVNEWLSQHGF